MEHWYIFDYSSPAIYHVELSEDVEDIIDYICKTYNLKEDYVYVMTTDTELIIEEL